MNPLHWMKTKSDIRQAQQYVRSQNARYTEAFVELPQETWPPTFQARDRANARKVFRSKSFLVVVFDEEGKTRLTVNRTMIDGQGNYLDGISWDDLQRIKNECGFADREAIELYPKDGEVVNVGNMRHLWILDEPCKFNWSKK